MQIVWKNGDHPELNALVEKEINELLSYSLGHTDDLITHLIEIGDIEDGPLIEVHGWAGKVYATYIAEPEWITAIPNEV